MVPNSQLEEKSGTLKRVKKVKTPTIVPQPPTPHTPKPQNPMRLISETIIYK